VGRVGAAAGVALPDASINDIDTEVPVDPGSFDLPIPFADVHNAVNALERGTAPA